MQYKNILVQIIGLSVSMLFIPSISLDAASVKIPKGLLSPAKTYNLNSKTAKELGELDNFRALAGINGNIPTEDFLYHLNHKLLFSEKPDDILIKKGLRNALLQKIKQPGKNELKYENKMFLSIPWDYNFLNSITGMNLDETSFLETMISNEKFSLLLGTLYQMSRLEVNYISNLSNPSSSAWKEIYKDKKLLMGMFILSNGLRVSSEGDLVLPGGKNAIEFWNRATGIDLNKNPMKFLFNLAVVDHGKLNYLYVFSQTLEPVLQKTLFSRENAGRMINIYKRIRLESSGKLNKNRIPQFKEFDFFVFLHSIQVHNNEIIFPGGIELWQGAIKKSEKNLFTKSPRPNDIPRKSLTHNRRKGFYVSISSGINFLNENDLKTKVAIENFPENSDFVTKSPFYWGPSYEVGYDLGKLILGFESGYINGKEELPYRGNGFAGNWIYKATIIPLLLNGYIKLTDSSKLDIFLNAGGGIYFARFNYRWQWHKEPYTSPFLEFSEKGRGKHFGYHLGAALHYDINKQLTLSFKVLARFVNINSDSRWIEGSNLPGENFIEAKDMLVKLNGPVVKIGLKYTFYY